jgi:hypothetical protein
MFGLALGMIALGLALRFFGRGLGLPAGIVKYGGSVLWATMVYFFVVALGPQLSRPRLALIAMLIAIAVELIRLAHTPWLDAFRLTLAGALLLGRIFSLWNLVAYAAGIMLGVAVDWRMNSTKSEEAAASPHGRLSSRRTRPCEKSQIFG